MQKAEWALVQGRPCIGYLVEAGGRHVRAIDQCADAGKYGDYGQQHQHKVPLRQPLRART